VTYTLQTESGSSLRGAGWRVVDTTTTLTQEQAEAVDLTGGFLIQRKGAASINIKLNAPIVFLSFFLELVIEGGLNRVWNRV
jgi:hypothetical protein